VPIFGAGARFLTAAVLRATFRFVTGADLAAGDCLRLAACAALAFFRACLAAFLLAFANFRARLSTAFASRTCRFAASARARAFFASARRRCAAADWFAPRS
jgi:hypothetical protein